MEVPTSPGPPASQDLDFPSLSRYPICCHPQQGPECKIQEGWGQICIPQLCPRQGQATAVPHPGLAAPQHTWRACWQGQAQLVPSMVLPPCPVFSRCTGPPNDRDGPGSPSPSILTQSSVMGR